MVISGKKTPVNRPASLLSRCGCTGYPVVDFVLKPAAGSTDLHLSREVTLSDTAVDSFTTQSDFAANRIEVQKDHLRHNP